MLKLEQGKVVDRRKIKKTLKRISALKTWQLLVLLVLVIFVAATALRLNSVEMGKRRDAVISADKDQDEAKAGERLKELSDFVSHHMNTTTEVLLVEIYKRDAQKIITDANEKANHNPNGNIYKRTAEVCDPINTGYNQAYFTCLYNELQKYSSDDYVATSVKFPDSSLYTHRFSSPLWTPDLAGWTILTSIIIVILIVAKLIFTLILNLILKKHKPFI